MGEPYSREILAILAFISDHPGCNTHQIFTSLMMDPGTLMDSLGELIESKLVFRHVNRSSTCEQAAAPETITYFVKQHYIVDGR